MTNGDAAAIAALNQTVRQLVEVIRELNRTLDQMGYPKGDDRDRGHHG